MKCRMHEDTEPKTIWSWADLNANEYFRFMDEEIVYRVIIQGDDLLHLDVAAGNCYDNDDRPIVKVELLRIERRVHIFKDKENQNAEDEEEIPEPTNQE